MKGLRGAWERGEGEQEWKRGAGEQGAAGLLLPLPPKLSTCPLDCSPATPVVLFAFHQPLYPQITAMLP